MNRDAKYGILKAFGNGIISKLEAVELLRSDGIIILDLSGKEMSPNQTESLLKKIPELEKYFTKIISLGHGKKQSE